MFSDSCGLFCSVGGVSFTDIGCGNGVLTRLLHLQGHRGCAQNTKKKTFFFQLVIELYFKINAHRTQSEWRR